MISFTTDQRFIVTGASSGIGEGVALLLNELGATVIGIGRNQERLEGMKAKAKHPENVFLEQKDLAENIPGLPAYVKSLKEKYSSENVNDIDGVKISFEKERCWVHLRKSNTEPIIRIYSEAPTQEKADALGQEIIKVAQSFI